MPFIVLRPVACLPRQNQFIMKQTRKNWKPLFFTQALGVLNDNLLKGAISFIAVLWVDPKFQAAVLAMASVALVLPYLILSPWASRLSMRYSKTKVVYLSKMAELPIMLIASAGFIFESLVLSFFALLLMGIQSAVYSPSKYGLIRDVGSKTGINFGTGMMEMLTYVSVLGGMVLAGFIGELVSVQKLVLATLFMALAALGWWASAGLEAKEESIEENNESIKPWTFVQGAAKEVSKIKGLGWTIAGLAGFWFLGSMIQLTFLIHLPQHYGLSSGEAALVIAAVASGIGLGCWLAGTIVKNRVELGLTPFAGFGMALCLTVLAVMDLGIVAFTLVSFGASFFSGLYKVPLNGWIQQRVEGRKLGKILALLNMAIYSGVLISALVFQGLSFLLSPTHLLIVIAGLAWVITLITWANIPEFLIRYMAVVFGKLVFRFKIRGAENIPLNSGALIVANHCSYLDFILMVVAVPRRVRFVMLKDVYDKRGINWILKKLNMIPIRARGGGNDHDEFNELVRTQIREGHVVCIFAEGTVTRTGQLLEFKKGIEHIMQELDAPIIPIHFGHVIGTPMSFEVGRSKMTFPTPSSLRKLVSISIGKALPSNSKAFTVRQRIKEMEAESFADSVEETETVGKYLFRSLRHNRFWITDAYESVTSAEFCLRALAIAGKLARPLSKVQTIAILLPKGIEGMSMATALQFMGKTIVFLDRSQTVEERHHILQRSKAKVLITTNDLNFTKYSPTAVQVMYVEDLRTTIGWLDKLGARVEMLLARIGLGAIGESDTDNSVLIFEPSADGEFKGIPLSHSNILSHQNALQQVFGTSSDKRMLSNFRLNNAFGFTFEFIYGLCSVIDLHLFDERLTDAELLEAVRKVKPQILLATASEMERLFSVGDDWNFIDYVHTDGQALNPLTSHVLQAYNIKQMMSAGLNECCSVFTVNTPDFLGSDIAGKTMSQIGQLDGSVGKPLPGVAIRVVDNMNPALELPQGSYGRVMIKGSSVIRTYLDNCYDWSKHFYDEWFITPLSGYLDTRGFLVLGKE
jgi:acyl-[acyl-carrier-protein]-phospholipid O-acyltransferase / long-chain-fatty-acid--[acyl-carrier-protein] ligase